MNKVRFLNFDGLLDHFKTFMTEHGVRLLKSPKTERPLEISGQYLLLSYLTAAMNTLQGHVTIESVSSAGEIDILVFFRGLRFIIETKIWYDKAKYEAGKQQLARYLQAANLPKGYMVGLMCSLPMRALNSGNRIALPMTHRKRCGIAFTVSTYGGCSSVANMPPSRC